MRILLVAARYFPHHGGLETVVYHLSQEFLHMGHEVRIVTNRYPRSLPAGEKIGDVRVTRFHFLLPELSYLKNRRPDLWLAGLWYGMVTQRNLRSMINEFQPDIINNHYLNETAEFIGLALSGSACLIPWVISFHGGDVEGEPLFDILHRQRFRWLSHQAQSLTACSAFVARKAEVLEPSLKGKINVIHNGVDVNRFSSAQPSLFGSPYILAVGQLVAHKGFDLLIRAFASVVEKYPALELRIAGDGHHSANLERLISGMGLGERVRLLGKVDELVVSSLMAGCLFVAMPSQKEPFGIVALEAMAAGKVVMAAPVGGLPEFLPCPPNRLVPLHISDWADALDEWLPLALSGKLKALSNVESARHLEWSQDAGRYLQIYEREVGCG